MTNETEPMAHTEDAKTMTEWASNMAAELEAEIASITLEFNEKIKQAGASRGIALSTEVSIHLNSPQEHTEE